MTTIFKPSLARLRELLQEAGECEARLRAYDAEHDSLGISNSVDPAYLEEVERAWILIDLIDAHSEALGLDTEPKTSQRATPKLTHEDVIRMVRGY
jgi:hypothetical protein